MNLSYELYSTLDGNSGYVIYLNGTRYIDQSSAPGVSGFVPMTASEAPAYAEADIAAMQATHNDAPAEPA